MLKSLPTIANRLILICLIISSAEAPIIKVCEGGLNAIRYLNTQMYVCLFYPNNFFGKDFWIEIFIGCECGY